MSDPKGTKAFLPHSFYPSRMNLEVEIKEQAITGLFSTQTPDNTTSFQHLRQACSYTHAIIRKWSTWEVFTHVANSLTEWS